MNKGDFVWHAEKREIGKIAELVKGALDQKKWGVAESGIFICVDLSLDVLSCDLFIGRSLFDEEEVQVLNNEEICTLKFVEEKVSEFLGVKLSGGASYKVYCVDNPMEGRKAGDREWIIEIYDQNSNFKKRCMVWVNLDRVALIE